MEIYGFVGLMWARKQQIHILSDVRFKFQEAKSILTERKARPEEASERGWGGGKPSP